MSFMSDLSLREEHRVYMEVSLNYCSQNGGNVYRAPYYNRNPNIGPRMDGNLGQSSYTISEFESSARQLLKLQQN